MTKTMKIIFTLSILINLVLIGVVGGSFYKHHKKYAHPIPKELSAESRAELEDDMKASREKMRAQFKELKKYHGELRSVVTAEEFDIDAYNESVDRILDTKDEMGKQKAEMMGNILSKLSLEERRKVSERFLKSFTHKYGRKGRKRPPE